MRRNLLIRTIVLTIISIYLISCSPSASEKGYNNKSKADSVSVTQEMANMVATNDTTGNNNLNKSNTSNQWLSSTAAQTNKKDTFHQFIRTAQLKFRVKNVYTSTIKIENIASKKNGFVTFTNLESRITNTENKAISKDSILETIKYEVVNTLQLRVPSEKLDSTLTEISQQINILDYRIIKSKDVAIEILGNTLTQNRSNKSGQRIETAIDKKGKKLDETVNGEEKLSNKQSQGDNAKLANLYLKDQINYSTIEIEIYQRENIKRDLYLNDKNTEAYQPGFLSKLGSEFHSGWEMLIEVVLFLAGIWWVLIIAATVVYFKFKADKKTKNK